MNFATRLNSFLNQGYTLEDAFHAIADVRSDAFVDLNFPEHTQIHGIHKTKQLLADSGLTLNGMAVRYRDEYKFGEFSVAENRTRAVDLAKQTVDAVKELGGTTLTLWLSYDGNDYAFQDDYATSWGWVVDSLQQIADYAAPIRLSIEAKPYEPRSFSILPGTGLSLYLMKQIDRPNVGLTLDFCHTLMARENPAFSLALVAEEGKLFGVHVNDGYGQIDDGLMFGSVNPARALEFVYYLKRAGYDGTVYFDTFPSREDAAVEFRTNIATFEGISQKIDRFGLEKLSAVIQKRDGIASQQLLQQLFY